MSLLSLRGAAATSVVVSFLAFGTTVIHAWGPRSECVEIYNAKPTDSCDSIDAWSGLTEAKLKALNPGLHDCGPPMDVQRLCLRSYTPTCYVNQTATETTCNYLLARWELTVADFVALNDNVDDACGNLVIGQPYCVSSAYCYPGNNNPYCDID